MHRRTKNLKKKTHTLSIMTTIFYKLNKKKNIISDSAIYTAIHETDERTVIITLRSNFLKAKQPICGILHVSFNIFY